MQVTFFQRRPEGTSFSIERVFANVRRSLGCHIDVKVAVARLPSRGLCRRIYNVIEACFRQGDINHITGDIHYVALLLDGRRTLLSIMDCVALERMRGIRWCLAYLFWYWLPIKRCRMVSVISESTRREVSRYVKCAPEKLRVVPCPVAEGVVASPRKFRAERPTILQVGTKANKNLLRVIEALAGIPCHLRIVGVLSKEQIASLHKCRVSYSAVAGLSDDDVIREYRECDMLVFASTYEGFGLPIVEAQATGRAVVTSDVYSMPEVAGDGACLVDPFDVESIRNGVVRVICDAAYRNELIERGYRNVERFRPEVIAAQYCALYQELSGNVTPRNALEKRAA